MLVGFKMNDHDLLMKVERDVNWITEMLKNHLKHHWCVTLGALTAALGALATAIILLVRGN